MGTWAASNFKGGAVVALKNAELGFWPLFFIGDSLSGWSLERERRFSTSSKSELEIPAKQEESVFNLKKCKKKNMIQTKKCVIST